MWWLQRYQSLLPSLCFLCSNIRTLYSVSTAENILNIRNEKQLLSFTSWVHKDMTSKVLQAVLLLWNLMQSLLRHCFIKSHSTHMTRAGESGERCCGVFFFFLWVCLPPCLWFFFSSLQKCDLLCGNSFRSVGEHFPWQHLTGIWEPTLPGDHQQQGMASTAQPCCPFVPVATSSPAIKIPCIPKSIFSTDRYYRRAAWNCKQC